MISHDFNMTSFSPCCHNWLACICFCAFICLLSRIFCLACYRLCVQKLLAFNWNRGDIVWNFGCMICGFPNFPRICWRFCLMILYSNFRLIVLYQFGIWCCWMFSYGSHIWAWMLFRKRHNKFLFLGFLRLLWYLLGIGHYWLDLFRWVGIGVFLYSCMFLQYYLFGDLSFFCYAY